MEVVATQLKLSDVTQIKKDAVNNSVVDNKLNE